jgi:hypothetical protein
MTFKPLMIAAAAMACLLSAGTSGAMAGSGRVSVHVGDYFDGNFSSGRHSGTRVSVNVGNNGDCTYYRDKWEETGKSYWKRKYDNCKG